MRVVNIHNPGKLIFGVGSLEQFTKDFMNSGNHRLFLFTIPQVLEQISLQLDMLSAKGIAVGVNTTITAEPTFTDFERCLNEVRQFKPDCIAGIGGGSVMDLAKILAVFNTFDKPLKDFVGINLLTERKTELICIPTTSGTGSEVSPNSILLDETDGIKKGIISPYLVPDAAYVDPELTIALPPDITAYTGIDAFTHCIEAFVNKHAHPLVDGYALNGISLISRNLTVAFYDGKNLEARSNLALGSLYGGMCLGPVNTGAVHALSYPLGSLYKIAHGLSNAILLQHVLKFNLPEAIDRFALVAKAMGLDDKSSDYDLAQDGIDHIKTIIRACGIPAHLRDLGIKETDIPIMAESAITVQRLLKNNVREVSVKDAIEIYENAY
jgi:alcohol dehydrogenase class IV